MLPQPHTQPLQSQYTHPSHQGSYSGTRGNQAFRLEVAQQPERARMCGFGDKVRCLFRHTGSNVSLTLTLKITGQTTHHTSNLRSFDYHRLSDWKRSRLQGCKSAALRSQCRPLGQYWLAMHQSRPLEQQQRLHVHFDGRDNRVPASYPHGASVDATSLRRQWRLSPSRCVSLW